MSDTQPPTAPPAGYPAAPPPPAGPPQGYVPPAPAPPPIPNDPHGIGAAAGRLGNHGRKAGNASFAILGVMMGEGEVVECLVQGRVNEADGLAALTNQRLLVLNERDWKPDVMAIPVDPATIVQGWQDDRTAALVFQSGDRAVTIDRIGDRPIAYELAQRFRARTGQQPPAPPPPPTPAPPPFPAPTIPPPATAPPAAAPPTAAPPPARATPCRRTGNAPDGTAARTADALNRSFWR